MRLVRKIPFEKTVRCRSHPPVVLYAQQCALESDAASPSVNRAKSDKLPDFEFFYSRKDKITDNWRYLADTAPNLFRHQVADSLVPGGLTGSLWWEPLFDATGKRLETIAQRFGTARWTL